MEKDKNSTNQEVTGSFTFDNENSYTQEMPSISSLLQRKSLRLTRSSSTEKSEDHSSEHSPSEAKSNSPTKKLKQSGGARGGFDEPSVEIERTMTNLFVRKETTGSNSFSHARRLTLPSEMTASIRPARRRGASSETASGPLNTQTEPQKLISWSIGRLAKSSDPLGRGLAHLMYSGATQALFLRILPPSKASTTPKFQALAAVAASEVAALWCGLQWDPRVSPVIWNEFVRKGFVELPPPGSYTDIGSNRNMARVAFGVPAEEFLTMIRVGAADACRGLIALTSPATLYTAWQTALPSLSAVPTPKRRAA